MAAKLAKLVARCVSDVARHPVPNVDVYMDEDDLCVWHLALHFTDDAPFVGGSAGRLKASGFALYVTMRFSEDFPAKPPRLKFLSPWINHQHIWGDRICHSLLTDDFLDYFQERRTHGTSMWNAACALADGEGVGGMPRYLQILRDYLATDLDYDEEKHVKYDDESLQSDVKRQRDFLPDFFETAQLLEYAEKEPSPSTAAGRAAGKGYGDSSRPVAAAGASEASEAKAEQVEHWDSDFFLKAPLIPGDAELHPCFDVALAVLPRRAPALSTAMASLCSRSFAAGAKVTDFGSSIEALLPYPCSWAAWTSVGKTIASATLEQLREVTAGYAVKLDSAAGESASELEEILNVAGELWKTTCISIVRGDGYESERAMMCFVSLHFWLLCEVKERPGLREHAAATVQELVQLIEKEPEMDLKAKVPDLGRFLVRFLLTEAELPLRGECAKAIVRELFSRNVRWVSGEMWADIDSPPEEQEAEVQAAFEAGNFGMKLTLVQSYYILRAASLGLDTLPALEACRGRPSQEAMKLFQQDCKNIKGIASYAEFFKWLQLDDLATQDVHPMLVLAVDESEERGYNAGVPR
eukprot:TRINITY_DN46916_c0_g1_i3.p1 TRINITY_DN46916_c0_g1~~TRINITY_DN46916_c0_g1_i3.p1  ORF type:complete len:582 (+),score=164.07 TRINITY_DN46916_c0_g1_i3:63-1808(+)